MEETQGKKSGQRFSAEGLVRYKTEKAIWAYCKGRTGGGYKKALLDKIAKFVYRAMSDDEILEIVNAGKANREKVQKMKLLRVDIFQSDADHLGLPGLLEQCQTVRERVNRLAPRCVQTFWGEFFTRAIDHTLSGDFCKKSPRKRRKKTAADEPEKTKAETVKPAPTDGRFSLKNFMDELNTPKAFVRTEKALLSGLDEVFERLQCLMREFGLNGAPEAVKLHTFVDLEASCADTMSEVASLRSFLANDIRILERHHGLDKPEQTELPLEVPRD